MIDKNFISLDLELNQPVGTIIQVGAVVGNLKSGKILETLEDNINTGEILDPFIIKLTGIKQEQVDNGISLYQSYENLTRLFKKYECFRNNIAWGHGDARGLKKQLYIKDDEMFLFGRREIDVKTLFVSYRFMKEQHHQAGLAKACNILGIPFIGRKHNAKDDSYNTFLVYRKLLQIFNGE